MRGEVWGGIVPSRVLDLQKLHPLSFVVPKARQKINYYLSRSTMSCNFQHDVTRSHYYYYDSYFLSIEGELEIMKLQRSDTISYTS